MTGQEIADIVNKIISGLRRKRSTHYKNEAINWGDIRVVEVTQVHELYPDNHNMRIEVLIEEAAPESMNFSGDIANIALEKYGLEISVRTEW